MKTQKDTKSVIRTLSTIIAAILLLCSISVIAGCKNKGNSNNNNSQAEVVLDKVSAAAYKETSVKPQKMAAFNFSEKSTDNSENESADNSESESPDVSADTPDYTFIFKSQTTINFDIKLNNPKNYYIMDFKLTCDEENIQYYDEKMEKWTPINDIWIRWSGSNNQESRYRLRLPNPEISPDKIKISEMYYSDRTDGTNKTAVNMNNKETYTVYKVEDDLVVTETVSNSCEKYIFKMAKKEGVEIKSFTVAGVDYMDRINAEGLYEMTSNGKIVVEYERKNGNVTYKGKVEKDIELIEFHINNYWKESGKGLANIDYETGNIVLEFYITGTDSETVPYLKGENIDNIKLQIITTKGEERFNFYGIKNLDEEWLKTHYIVIAGKEYNIWDTFANTTKE